MRKYILVFFDDILIYKPNWHTYLKHVRSALRVLQAHSLLLKKSKCSFGVTLVEYLRDIITATGVANDPKIVAAKQVWPQPQNLKQLRGFLGLTDYYRRLIRNYGVISRPLTNLLKKDNFGWSSKAEVTFHTLKQALSSAPVLALPNLQKHLMV